MNKNQNEDNSRDDSPQAIKPEYVEGESVKGRDSLAAPPKRSLLGPFLFLALAVGAVVVTGSMTSWFGFTSNEPTESPAAAAIRSQLDEASALPNAVEEPDEFAHLPPLRPLVPKESNAILQEGRDVAAHLITLTDGKLDALEMQARLEFEFGDREIAKKIWTKIIRENPKYTFALRGLGDIATLDGDLAGAVKYFREAVVLEPSNIARQITLAVALLADNQTDEAGQVLESVIKVQSKNPIAQQTLGQVKSQQQDFEGARKAYAAAVENDPTLEKAHYGLAKALMRLGKAEEAKIHQAEHVKLRELDKVQLQSGRQEYDDVNALQNDVGRFYADMARVYLGAGNDQAAELLLVRASRMNVDDINARQALAWMASKTKGRLFDAIRWLEEAAEIQPDQFSVVSEIAHLYGQSGQLDQSEVILTAFVERNPQDPQALGAVSRFFLEATQDFPKAIEYAQALTEVSPTGASFAWLGQVLKESGEIPQAVVAMQRAVELEPGNVEFPQLLALFRESATENDSGESTKEEL